MTTTSIGETHESTRAFACSVQYSCEKLSSLAIAQHTTTLAIIVADSRCSHVILPKELAKMLPKGKLLSDAEWRAYGVQQSRGWEHYAVHKPEPHILLFRRPLGTDPTTGRVSAVGDLLLIVAHPRLQLNHIATCLRYTVLMAPLAARPPYHSVVHLCSPCVSSAESADVMHPCR